MQIFVKIADYQSITRAAEDIQMTQPAVSSTLKRIEEELGYPLFIRRGKRLILNEQGKVFYSATQELFGEIAQLHGSIHTGNPQKDELIVTNCTSFLGHIPKRIRQFGSYCVRQMPTKKNSIALKTLPYRGWAKPHQNKTIFRLNAEGESMPFFRIVILWHPARN